MCNFIIAEHVISPPFCNDSGLRRVFRCFFVSSLLYWIYHIRNGGRLSERVTVRINMRSNSRLCLHNKGFPAILVSLFDYNMHTLNLLGTFYVSQYADNENADSCDNLEPAVLRALVFCVGPGWLKKLYAHHVEHLRNYYYEDKIAVIISIYVSEILLEP